MLNYDTTAIPRFKSLKAMYILYSEVVYREYINIAPTKNCNGGGGGYPHMLETFL